MIEDVITSGGQVATSVAQMRGLGLIADDVLCVVDREQGGRAALESIGCRVTSVFTASDLAALAAAPDAST